MTKLRRISLALSLLAAGAVGLWWVLIPHVLSASALWLAVSAARRRDPAPRWWRLIVVSAAAAVLALSLANEVASLRGTAFLPRWE